MEPVGISRPIGKGHGRPIRIKYRQFTAPVVMPGLWPYPSAYQPCMDGMKEEDLQKENYDPKNLTSSSQSPTGATETIPWTIDTTMAQNEESQLPASTSCSTPPPGFGRKRSRAVRHAWNYLDSADLPPTDPRIFQNRPILFGRGPGRVPVNSEIDSMETSHHEF